MMIDPKTYAQACALARLLKRAGLATRADAERRIAAKYGATIARAAVTRFWGAP